MNYILLQNPGHNRVYYNSADKLALAELTISSHRLSSAITDIKVVVIEDVRYLSFDTENALSENDLQILSRLSFVFAIFKTDSFNGNICLIPVKKANYEYLDSKISSLLKYQGKTNELFTRMMINVALLSSTFDYSQRIQILDPFAGKGTTLFEGAINGFDAYGIEIDSKFVKESSVFFKRYLETERLKHNSITRQIYGTSKSNAVTMHEFEYANSKSEFNSTESIKKLGIVCGNSKDTYKYFKKEIFHLLVADLPYGIFHGNTRDKKNASITRNPFELLSDCLPEWHKVLKKGGIVVVAWNSFVVSAHKLSDIFSANGFEVLSQPPYNEFEHMVDKAIKRDIIVARKA